MTKEGMPFRQKNPFRVITGIICINMASKSKEGAI